MAQEPDGTRDCQFCKARVVVVRDGRGKFQVLDVRAPVYELADQYTCYEAGRKGQGGKTGVIAVLRPRAYVSHWTTCTGREAAKAAQRDRKAAQ